MKRKKGEALFSLKNSISAAVLVLVGVALGRWGDQMLQTLQKSMQAATFSYFPDYKYPFVLPELAYGHDALEPYISTQIMYLHHVHQHRLAVENLNETMREYAAYQQYSLEYLLTHLEVLPYELAEKLKNFGGSHFNHSFFWRCLSPAPQGGGMPQGRLKEAIDRKFGSFENFKRTFAIATLQCVGSVWTWLCCDHQKDLVIVTTMNYETPLTRDLLPILSFDVWEHAYYLQHHHKRLAYVLLWWNVVNWAYVEHNYDAVLTALAHVKHKKDYN